MMSANHDKIDDQAFRMTTIKLLFTYCIQKGLRDPLAM